jgi:hypothetical protein
MRTAVTESRLRHVLAAAPAAAMRSWRPLVNTQGLPRWQRRFALR